MLSSTWAVHYWWWGSWRRSVHFINPYICCFLFPYTRYSNSFILTRTSKLWNNLPVDIKSCTNFTDNLKNLISMSISVTWLFLFPQHAYISLRRWAIMCEYIVIKKKKNENSTLGNKTIGRMNSVEEHEGSQWVYKSSISSPLIPELTCLL